MENFSLKYNTYACKGHLYFSQQCHETRFVVRFDLYGGNFKDMDAEFQLAQPWALKSMKLDEIRYMIIVSDYYYYLYIRCGIQIHILLLQDL